MDEKLSEYLAVISGQLESMREILKAIYEEIVLFRGDQDERQERIAALYTGLNQEQQRGQLNLALKDGEPLWE